MLSKRNDEVTELGASFYYVLCFHGEMLLYDAILSRFPANSGESRGDNSEIILICS